MIRQLFASSSFALCGCAHLFLTQASPASCPLQAVIGCANELFSARSRTPSATCCKPQFGGHNQTAVNDSSISSNNEKLQRGEIWISLYHLFNLLSHLCPFIYSVTILDKSAKTLQCQAKDCRFASRLHLQDVSFCWKPHRPQPDSSRFTRLCYGSICIPGIPWWTNTLRLVWAVQKQDMRHAEGINRTNGGRFKKVERKHHSKA